MWSVKFHPHPHGITSPRPPRVQIVEPTITPTRTMGFGFREIISHVYRVQFLFHFFRVVDFCVRKGTWNAHRPASASLMFEGNPYRHLIQKFACPGLLSTPRASRDILRFGIGYNVVNSSWVCPKGREVIITSEDLDALWLFRYLESW